MSQEKTTPDQAIDFIRSIELTYGGESASEQELQELVPIIRNMVDRFRAEGVYIPSAQEVMAHNAIIFFYRLVATVGDKTVERNFRCQIIAYFERMVCRHFFCGDIFLTVAIWTIGQMREFPQSYTLKLPDQATEQHRALQMSMIENALDAVSDAFTENK